MTLPFLPVWTEDVFLQYRPFPDEPSSTIAKHWHEIAAALAVYFAVQFVSPIIFSRWLGKTYTGLPHKRRVDFDIHVVLMVQCIFSVLILLPMWNHPYWQNRLENPRLLLFGYTPYGGFVSAATLGYFVWDLYVCLRYYTLFGPGFLLHAAAALYVFACTFVPYCQPWIPAFLIFELSTPFVNINWFGSKLPGLLLDTVVIVNGALLLLTFFSVRILWGFYSVALIAQDMWQMRAHIHLFFPVTILGINVLLDLLNIFWFVRMLQIARKKTSGKTSKKD